MGAAELGSAESDAAQHAQRGQCKGMRGWLKHRQHSCSMHEEPHIISFGILSRFGKKAAELYRPKPCASSGLVASPAEGLRGKEGWHKSRAGEDRVVWRQKEGVMRLVLLQIEQTCCVQVLLVPNF